ncbi:hypothetical protein ACRAKI_36165 [Saccharothrix isguenensis]
MIAYVLCEVKNQGGVGQWERLVRRTPVDPNATPDELKSGVRLWALEQLSAGQCDGGLYGAYLVEVDQNGGYDTCAPIHVKDVVWFYESEYVPADPDVR